MPQNSPLRFPLMATLLHKSIPTSPTPYPVRLPSFFPASLRPQFHFQTGGLNPFSRRNFLRASALIPDCSNDLSKTASSVPEEGNENPIGHKSDEIDCVEVFGIGSRKDAVLDYCLNSPFLSPSLRFWKILVNDSPKVQLQQRFSNEDMTTRVVEAPSVLQPCSKAVILVASAAYGNDDIAAVDILREIMSKKGLFIGIILRPFSFEGRRRQDEVNHLVGKLQEYADFYVDVDTNTLLENDLVTLDEAVKTSNNAVLMAMNAISILISEKHIKLHDAAHGGHSELKVPEIQKILKAYREAKIGFGAGFNIKSSVLQAMYDCPFLGINVKNSSGVIICILASSGIIDYHDITAILQVVRSTTGWKGEIIVSIVHDSKLDLNIIRTTIIAFGFIGQQSNKKIGIFSRLAQHFPFIFNILNKQSPRSLNTKGSFATECQHLSVEKSLENHYQTLSEVYHDSAYEDLGVNTQEVASMVNNIDEDTSFSGNHKSASQGSDTEFSDSDSYPFTYMQSVKDNHKLRECTKEGAADMDCNEASDSMTIYRLPVGVKRFQQFDDCPTNNKHHKKWILEDSCKVLSDDSSVSWDAMGQRAYDANKQGILSNRAASMLEAERDSPNKKWTPVLEIEYRGGIYHGRIQGGLPEGKGRLSFGDGSIYDGMWRFGKRSGLGTLYFKNGDVFQGLWRDDVMHGKGWLYFHTGDRWFVNFWKGKANGEGRFYSKLGEVFFGHFKDGWRHGHFLCIGVDGTRCHEVWEEGVLVSREQLEPDANDVA